MPFRGGALLPEVSTRRGAQCLTRNTPFRLFDRPTTSNRPMSICAIYVVPTQNMLPFMGEQSIQDQIFSVTMLGYVVFCVYDES